MTKFPSHLLTKRIRTEILTDAAQLAAKTLPIMLPPEEALRPLTPGKMLAIRFDRERKTGDWLRVAFEDRHDKPLGDNTYRIAYDGACDGFPVTKLVMAYSISAQVCAPFKDMVRSGLRQKEVERWVLEVAKLARYSAHYGPDLIEMHQAVLRQAGVSGPVAGAMH